MILDRRPVVFVAPRPMHGHRCWLDIPRENRRPSAGVKKEVAK